MLEFVAPESVRLDLPEGDWILVRKELNAGQAFDLFKRGYGETANGSRADIPHLTLLAYLLDWSAVDADGRPVVIRGKPVDDVSAILRALKIDSYVRILEAVDAHDKRKKLENEAMKADPFGEPASLQTSTSAA
jgi:hypothetical protein